MLTVIVSVRISGTATVLSPPARRPRESACDALPGPAGHVCGTFTCTSAVADRPAVAPGERHRRQPRALPSAAPPARSASAAGGIPTATSPGGPAPRSGGRTRARSVVVGHRRQDAGVGGQRHGRQRAPLAHEASHQLGREMLRVAVRCQPAPGEHRAQRLGTATTPAPTARRLSCSLRTPEGRFTSRSRSCIVQRRLWRASRAALSPAMFARTPPRSPAAARMTAASAGSAPGNPSQRMPFPVFGHQQAAQIAVTVEHDAEHIPDFALEPAGAGPDALHGRQCAASPAASPSGADDRSPTPA